MVEELPPPPPARACFSLIIRAACFTAEARWSKVHQQKARGAGRGMRGGARELHVAFGLPAAPLGWAWAHGFSPPSPELYNRSTKPATGCPWGRGGRGREGTCWVLGIDHGNSGRCDLDKPEHKNFISKQV